MKTLDEVQQLTAEIVEDMLGLIRGDLSAEVDLVDEFSIDSLDLMEFTLSLEDEFDIVLEDQLVSAQPRTVKAIAEVVYKLLPT